MFIEATKEQKLRKCYYCQELLPLTNKFFFRNRTLSKGLGYECKKCKPSGWNGRNRSREKLVELLGNKCIRCGFEDKRALQIDHKKGGGQKERKVAHGNYYDEMVNKLENYQILCANCNWIKRYENNEHN